MKIFYFSRPFIFLNIEDADLIFKEIKDLPKEILSQIE